MAEPISDTNNLQSADQRKERDVIYFNRLKKDIKRVEEHLRQADAAIATFGKDIIQDSPIEKRILAMYAAYGTVPYRPEKNDTITTASTSVLLENMIEDKKAVLKEFTNIHKDPGNDLGYVTQELLKIRDARVKERDMMKSILELELDLDLELNLEKKSEKTRFGDEVMGKLKESEKLDKKLQLFLRKVSVKYTAYCDSIDGIVNDKDELQLKVDDLMKFFNELINGDWVEVRSSSHIEAVVKIMENGSILQRENGKVRLRGLEPVK